MTKMDGRRKPHTEAWKKRVSELLKGIKRSEETKARMSEAFKGRKYSEKTRNGISETRKRLFAEGKLSTWNKGLDKSDERVFENISGGSRETQFKPGPRPETKKENNSNWKGGRVKTKSGYWMIRMPEHPEAHNDYVFEHRIIMERHLGRRLKPEEVVHHRNCDKTDNRIENLMLLPNNGAHMREHAKIRRRKR